MQKNAPFCFLFLFSLISLLLFSLFRIDRSMWLDEANSVYIANNNFIELISHLQNDSSPPIYYLFLSVWIRLFGISELAVRGFSSLFYVFSVFSIYLVCKSLYDRKTGFLCSFLYLVSSIAIRNAQNARMYSLLGLIAVWSIYFFFKFFIVNSSSRKHFVFFIIFNALGILTHYWFFFIILSQLIVCVFVSRKKLMVFSFGALLSGVPFALLWLPSFLMQLGNGSTSWMWKPTMREAFWDTFIDFYNSRFTLFTGANDYLALLFYALCSALILLHFEKYRISLQNLKLLGDFFKQKENTAFLILLLSLLILPYLVSQLRPIFLVGRYTIIDFIPFVMILGATMSRFANRNALVFFSYALLIMVSFGFVIHTTNTDKESDKITAKFLIENAQKDDAIIFSGLTQGAIDYYLDLMNSQPFSVKVSYPLEIASHRGWRDVQRMLNDREKLDSEANEIVQLLQNSLGGKKRIWLVYSYDEQIAQILKAKLDVAFNLLERKEVKGPGHSCIFVYTRRN